MEILTWIQSWYKKNCNANWEHSYGIRIESLDNPGWQVKIDLAGTDLSGAIVEYQLIENSEDDWYGLKIENDVFLASGDPHKLEFILEKFRALVLKRCEDQRP